MIKGGQRIATATGVMLADPNGLGNALQTAAASIFDPAYWSARGQLAAVAAGRGSAWFIGPKGAWVLRHYRRGGLIARISKDRYGWLGEDRVRAFAEWRLLDYLAQRSLQVPRPVAAGYRRAGMTYRCDLITLRIAGAETLSAALATDSLPAGTWRAIGAAVARLHDEGVDHADLNAHNILLDGSALISIIDFDRARLRSPGAWASKNLQRLHRSLGKVTATLPAGRFEQEDWAHLLKGYRAD
jgi:3-deoxy-D-manno-octulosonic acid kinase